MAKLNHYFTLNSDKKDLQVFYDAQTGLHLLTGKPGGLLNYNPALHKKVAEALQFGTIVTITKAQYEAMLEGEALEAPNEGADSDLDEETEDAEDLTVKEAYEKFLEGKPTKEDLLVWAENQNFIEEDELEHLKGLTKKAAIQEYLTELVEAYEETEETEEDYETEE
jgi:hypothetical protein